MSTSTEPLPYAKWKEWFETSLNEIDRLTMKWTTLEQELFAACVKISQVRFLNGEKNFCELSAESASMPDEVIEYWWRMVDSKTLINRPHYPSAVKANQWDLIHVVAYLWYEEETK